MNKKLIAKRFSKASSTYTDEAKMQQQIAAIMSKLLQQYVNASVKQVIEIGCGTGTFSRMLWSQINTKHLIIKDLCLSMAEKCKDLLSKKEVKFIPGDAEQLDFPPSNSLITSCSTIQWFDSVHNFFSKCYRLLDKEGYIAFSTFGPKNFQEIRQLTHKGLDYLSISELQNILANHFEILHMEGNVLTASFSHPLHFLHHLKQTGVTGVDYQSGINDTSMQKNWTRRDVHDFCINYERLYHCPEGISLTYHPIYIIAKKKKE